MRLYYGLSEDYFPRMSFYSASHGTAVVNASGTNKIEAPEQQLRTSESALGELSQLSIFYKYHPDVNKNY